jgi:hypothetical protein
MDSKYKSQAATKLKALSTITANQAFSTSHDKTVLLNVASDLLEQAGRIEHAISNAPAVAVLPVDATEAEIRHKRRTQATRVGENVYLPIWKELMYIMPSSLLRSAIFSVARDVQKMWTNESATPTNVADERIPTTSDVTMLLSGYALCQFDRHVYSTCLNFYRERPLARDNTDSYVETSFYIFAREMGGQYGKNPHKAIKASLMRLSMAQIRLRSRRINLKLPKLLSVKFDDSEKNGDDKGADLILLQIPSSVSELFGRGAWTAINQDISRFDELKGWIGCFYASHSKEYELPIDQLYHMSGYKSEPGNFKIGVTKALDKLQKTIKPLVESYSWSKDNSKITVKCIGWKKDAKKQA